MTVGFRGLVSAVYFNGLHADGTLVYAEHTSGLTLTNFSILVRP